MSKKVITFGEIMLRLSPPGFNRFVQTDSFDVTYGGGEANVAISLANYGLHSFFISKLPDHEIGQSALNALRSHGVNDAHILRGGERLGVYYLENGASQRGSKVIYDRANSSITTIKKDDINWAEVFKNADWFHWTGITPALGENVQQCLIEACKQANAAGVTISCDLNFRKKLWTEKQAQSAMIPLMEYVDVCIANEEDAEKSLGFKAGHTNIDAAELDSKGYLDLIYKLKSEFDFETVAITLRESYSASRNGWSALMHDDRDCKIPVRSNRYEIQIVDRVGGGDAFASGLIYGLLTKNNTREALEFAVAASCLKHTIPGDFNLVYRDEVENLIMSGGAGRVER